MTNMYGVGKAGRPTRWKMIPFALLTLGLSLGGVCDDTPPPPPPDPMAVNNDDQPVEPIPLMGEVFLNEANFPVSMVFASGDRMFFSEKNTGMVRLVKNGELIADPVLEVPVNNAVERGTLGLVLHPDFNTNGFLYLFYVRSASGQVASEPEDVLDARVVRFVIDGDQATGDEEVVVQWPVAMHETFHLGGNMRFGLDGKLYVTRGDLTIEANAQDISDLNGKFLRYNDDGTIPTDNPFGAANPVFALGVRNSFDLVVDPDTGVFFATENGTTQHDEVNRIIAGGNYGWPEVVGFADDAPGDPDNETLFMPANGTYVDPLIDEADPPAVGPTGIDIAPNDLYGEGMAGDLFYGEFNTAMVWRVTLDETRSVVVDRILFAEKLYGGITDLVFAPDGHMYVSTTSRIYKVLPSTGDDVASN